MLFYTLRCVCTSDSMCLACVLSLSGERWWGVSWDVAGRGHSPSTLEGSWVSQWPFSSKWDLDSSLHSGCLSLGLMSCAVAPVTSEGSGRERKKSRFALLWAKNQHCHGLPAEPKQAKVWNRLSGSLWHHDPIIQEIYSLPGCDSCFCGVYKIFYKGEVNTPCLKLRKSKRLCLQSVTQNSKLCNFGSSISHPSVWWFCPSLSVLLPQ